MEEPSRLEIGAPPAVAAEAVAEAAEAWGGSWEPGAGGGRLVIPVTAGLRRGVLVAGVEITRLGASGARLELSVEERHDQLNRPAVVILLLGAAGALTATLWPLFPRLLSVAPLAVVLAISAWLLIVARLRNSGPEEFLELVEQLTAGEVEASGEDGGSPA